MSKQEFDQNDQDNSSMFDFLSEDKDGQSTPRPAIKKSKRKAMPVIRKPVPIAKSGPLLPPKPGDPVEPPPPLTTGLVTEIGAGTKKRAKISDELDFLDDPRAGALDLRPPNTSLTRSKSPDNVRSLPNTSSSIEQQNLEKEFQGFGSPLKTNDEFETDWQEGHASYEDFKDENSTGWLKRLLPVAGLVLIAGGSLYAYTAGYFDELLPPNDGEFGQLSDRVALQPDDVGGSELLSPDNTELLPIATEPNSLPVVAESSLGARFRSQLAAIESMIENGSLAEAEQALLNLDRSVYGYGAVEFSALEDKIFLINSNQGSEPDAVALAEAERLEQIRLDDESASLVEKLRQIARNAEAAAAETARVEQIRLEAEQARAEAEQVRIDAEQARIEVERVQREEEQARIEVERVQREEEQARIEVERVQREEEQARIEVERVQREEQQARIEVERVQREEQQVRIEVERAQKQAEQARIDAENTRLAQTRADAEKATEALLENRITREPTSTAQGELERTQDQFATEIAASNADKIRLDALEEVAREEARRQITSADRLATDRRIAEERAAAERLVAREARFERAREIEAEIAAAKAAAEVDALRRNSENQLAVQEQKLSSPQASLQSSDSQTLEFAQASQISDAELQTVYRRFTDLQNAISDRDISEVVKLTERSGLRVQQFMQIFENSVGIDVRIRNVSTSNATGEINGTLQIRSIKRNDGTLAAPPANLESIKVMTKREGDNWSVIRW